MSGYADAVPTFFYYSYNLRDMNKKHFFRCLVISLLFSCDQQDKTPKDYPVLQVSLDETQTSLSDLFEKIELIPLETNNESLIKRIVKIKHHQDYFYVF